jgi:hypothetical protein
MADIGLGRAHSALLPEEEAACGGSPVWRPVLLGRGRDRISTLEVALNLVKNEEEVLY